MHVITKAEAEYVLDREEFDRLLVKHGKDTLLTWWYTAVLKLPRADQPMVRGTESDVRG